MFFQARIFIRSALIYLLASMIVGGLVFANQGLQFAPKLGVLLPVFYHLLMVGWSTQLICGVALWLFPVHTREQPHGNQQIGWLTYITLNLGLLLRVLCEPLQSWSPSPWSAWGLVASGILQIIGMWAFVILIWPRVKERAAKPNRLNKEKE
jgi:hypothetical protein